MATILLGSLHYINPRGKGGARWSKLSEDDLELIELLKIEKPSVSLLSCLEEMYGVDVSMATVSIALKQRLPSSPYRPYTRKKL